MIFREELAEKILRGEKTATRRRMSDNPRSPWYQCKCAYEIGQVFTINPGRGKLRIGEARVTAVYRRSLGNMTVADARREGFGSPLQFRAAWRDINGSFDFGETVWVVEFKLVQDEGEGRDG